MVNFSGSSSLYLSDLDLRRRPGAGATRSCGRLRRCRERSGSSHVRCLPCANQQAWWPGNGHVHEKDAGFGRAADRYPLVGERERFPRPPPPERITIAAPCARPDLVDGDLGASAGLIVPCRSSSSSVLPGWTGEISAALLAVFGPLGVDEPHSGQWIATIYPGLGGRLGRGL